jgi:hypothetical protein
MPGGCYGSGMLLDTRVYGDDYESEQLTKDFEELGLLE